MSKLLIILLILFIGINCIMENKVDLQLYLDSIERGFVGKIGTAVVIFKQKDYPIFFNTKKETCFYSKISDGKNNYNVSCGLIYAFRGIQVYVFCNIEEHIPYGEYKILFNETKPFTYKNYSVTLNVEKGKSLPKFIKFNRDIVDLYSEPQEITIENGVDSYELKFNIVSYNKELLFLGYYLILDCKVENDILRCFFTKNDILGYFPLIRQNNKIYYIEKENYNSLDILLIGNINIKMKEEIKKKDIFVGIKKLLVDTNEKHSTIAYETNVTDIYASYLYGQGIFLNFTNKDNEGKESEIRIGCSFLKYDDNPLYLVCPANDEGENRLKEIKEEIIFDKLNIFYNYRIQPVKNNEIIKTKDYGFLLIWYYPRVLDFTKNSGNITVLYNTGINIAEGFTYNEDENDLFCDSYYFLKRCYVSKEHFKGKKNGFYFIKHNNHLGKKTINYEVPPIKVILDSKGNIIGLPLIYLLVLFLIMI